MEYIFLDLTRAFLQSQLALAGKAGWDAKVLNANAEQLPLAEASVDLVIDNENLADMTPVHLSREELETRKGTTSEHQECLDLIQQLRLNLDTPYPDEAIFNYGAIQFLHELWRVLKPGGRALLIEFGIDSGLAGPRAASRPYGIRSAIYLPPPCSPLAGLSGTILRAAATALDSTGYASAVYRRRLRHPTPAGRRGQDVRGAGVY